MKKRLYLITGLLLLWGITRAQYYRNNDSGFLIGINAGYTYPLGDFGKINKNGIGGNISAKYLINRVIGIGFEGGYHTFKTDIKGNENVAQDYKCSLIPMVVEATFYIPTWDRTLLPYCGLHFGGYLTRLKISQKPNIYGDPAVSEKLSLFSPGVGADIGLLVELSEFVKLDVKVKGDYVLHIKDDYKIDDYTEGNIGFNKMMNIGVSIGLLYCFK